MEKNTLGALDKYKQAAALGDANGKYNYATLQQAIQQAQQSQQKQADCDPFSVANRMHRGQMRAYFANHPGASISEANAHINH